MMRGLSLTLSAMLLLAALGCQRESLPISAESSVVTVASPAPALVIAPDASAVEVPVVPELPPQPVAPAESVVAAAPAESPATEAATTPAAAANQPAAEEVALADSVVTAPATTVAAIAPLAVAISIGPPKTMTPPKIPFSVTPRTPETPPTERQGKLELYKPASPAVEFLPKRLPEETAIPANERPVLDEPELNRSDSPRPELPSFPRGLGARKHSVDPKAVPPLAPLSVTQLEKVQVIDDPGGRETRQATQPPAQPVKPEIAPADPRVVDPEENERLFRLGVPPPEADPPASVPPERPMLPVAPTPTPKA